MTKYHLSSMSVQTSQGVIPLRSSEPELVIPEKKSVSFAPVHDHKRKKVPRPFIPPPQSQLNPTKKYRRRKRLQQIRKSSVSPKETFTAEMYEAEIPEETYHVSDQADLIDPFVSNFFPSSSLFVHAGIHSSSIQEMVYHLHPKVYNVLSSHFVDFIKYMSRLEWRTSSEAIVLSQTFLPNVNVFLEKFKNHYVFSDTVQTKFRLRVAMCEVLFREVDPFFREVDKYCMYAVKLESHVWELMEALYEFPLTSGTLYKFVSKLPYGCLYLQNLLYLLLKWTRGPQRCTDFVDAYDDDGNFVMSAEEMQEEYVDARVQWALDAFSYVDRTHPHWVEEVEMFTAEMEQGDESMEKHENITFANQHEVVTDEGIKTGQLQTTAQNISMPERQWHIQNVMQRPILKEVLQWSINDETDKIIKTYTIPSETLIGQHKNLVKSFLYFRGHPKITIQINSTVFHYGRLLVVWIPMASNVALTDYLWNSNNYLTFPRVLIDASQSNSGELVIPFVHMYSYFNSYYDREFDYLGQLKFIVFNRLGTATTASPTVDVSVYVSYDTCELHQPMWDHGIRFPPVQGTELFSAEAGVEGLVKSAVESLPGGPILNNLMTSAGSLGGSAQNCDKPSDPIEIRRWVPNTVTSLNFGDGIERCNRLSLYPGTGTKACPQIVGATADDMDLKLLCKLPSRLKIANWKTDQGPGTKVFTLPVYPTCYIRVKTDSTVSPKVQVYEPTLLAWISRAFKYWSGELKYSIQVVSSQMQTGRLAFCFAPGMDASASFSNSFLLNSTVMDIAVNKEITLPIPFMCERPFLRCDKLMDPESTDYIPTQFTGYLYCWVLNRLTSPTSTSQTVEINVNISAGEDFKLEYVTDLSLVKGIGSVVPAKAPKASELFKAEMETTVTERGQVLPAPTMASGSGQTSFSNDYIMGESWMDLKSILRRKYLVYETETGVDRISFMAFPNTPHLSAVNKDFGGPTKIQYRTPIAHFAELFTFWEGSLRYSIVLSEDNSNCFVTVYFLPGINILKMEATKPDEHLQQILGSLENQGAMIAATRIQNSMEFEIPFISPFPILQTMEANTQTAFSSNGTVMIQMRSPFADGQDIFMKVYQSIGDDFRFHYLRGAPRIQIENGYELTRKTEDTATDLYGLAPWFPPKKPEEEEFTAEMFSILSLPSKLSKTLDSVERVSSKVDSLLDEDHLSGLLSNLVSKLPDTKLSIMSLTISVSIIVSGFNSFLQADSLWIKACAIIAVVSELLGAALLTIKDSLVSFVMAFLNNFNAREEGNVRAEADLVSFVAPLMSTLGIGALLIGFKQIPDDKQTSEMIRGMNDKLRLFNGSSLALKNFKQLWQDMRDFVESVIDQVLEWTAPDVLARMKLTSGFEEIEQWVRDVEEEFTTDYVDKYNMDPEYRIKMFNIHTRALQYQGYLLSGKCGREGSVLKEYIRKALDMWLKVKTAFAELPNRIDPLCVCLEGPPGTGKSTMIVPIVNKLMDDMGYKRGDRLCAVNWSEEYFTENYNNQPGIYGDDFGAIRDIAQLKTFFCLKSNVKYPLNMAFAKGKYFSSEYVVMTSNIPYPKYVELADCDALLRRRDLLVSVRYKKDHDTPNFDFSHCEFRFRDPRKEGEWMPWGDWMDYQSMLAICKSFQKHYFMIQQKIICNILKENGYTIPAHLLNAEIGKFHPRYTTPKAGPELNADAPSATTLTPSNFEFPKKEDDDDELLKLKAEAGEEYVIDIEALEKDPVLNLLDEKIVDRLEWVAGAVDGRPGLKGQFLPIYTPDERDEIMTLWAEDQAFLTMRGRDIQTELLRVVKRPGLKALFEKVKDKLSKFKDWCAKQWTELVEKFPIIEYLNTWPVKLAAGVIALGSLVQVGKKVVHACVCSSLRALGFRCIKCGKWPKYDDCKDKEWLKSEWERVYGATSRYEDGRITTLEEENALYEVSGMPNRPTPSIGTEIKYNAEAYSQNTNGQRTFKIFAEHGPYSQDVRGQAKTHFHVEGGVNTQRTEDLVNKRIIPYTKRLRVSTGLTKGAVNGLAIGGRNLLIPGHFMHWARKATKFEVFHGNRWMEVWYEKDRAQSLPNKDAVVYNMPIQFNEHRSMLLHFISEKDIPYLGTTTGYLIQRTSSEVTTTWYLDEITPVEKVEFNDSEQNVYRVRSAWSYPFPKAEGSCGSALITLNNRVSGQIIGVHCAGSGKTGMSQLITREMLEPYVTTKLGTPVPMCSQEPLQMTVEGHFSPIGRVGPGEGVFQSKKTDIIPTSIHEIITPHVTEPSVLDPYDSRLETVPTNVMRKAVEKYAPVAMEFPPDISKIVEQSFKQDLETWKVQRKARILTEKEAVVGCPEYEGFERLPLNTSPGYPYVLSRPSGAQGKAYLFDDAGQVRDQELKKNFGMRLLFAKKGERVPSTWVCCLKDERRKLEKIKQGSTRLFSIPPVDYSLLARMYTLDFVVAMKDNRAHTFSKVGIDPQSLEWTEFYNWLLEKSDVGFAGDYATFDGTLKAGTIERFYGWVDAFFEKFGTCSEEDKRVRRVLANELVHTIHLCGRDLFVIHKGNKSGNPLTTYLNTYAGEEYLRTAWIGLARKHAPEMATIHYYRKYVRTGRYGDDDIVAVSRDVIEWYNQETVSEFLAEYGIKYTNSEKDGVSKFLKISQTTFLKNGFGKHESEAGIVVPLMAKDTINELLNWTRVAPYQDQLLQDNINDSLRFSYFYGTEYFNTQRNKILAALRQVGKTKLEVMTYDDFHFWFLFVIGKFSRQNQAEGFLEKVSQTGNSQVLKLTSKMFECAPYKVLSRLGLLAKEDNTIKTDSRYAIAIPSGEGKTWLCNQYPTIFVDHDEILLPETSKLLKSGGISMKNWQKVFENEFPQEDRRILLTHHPANTKRRILGSYVLPSPTYIRANIYNRLRLTNPKRLDRDLRNKEIIELARQVEPALFGV